MRCMERLRFRAESRRFAKIGISVIIVIIVIGLVLGEQLEPVWGQGTWVRLTCG